jgi:hypothetical protein
MATAGRAGQFHARYTTAKILSLSRSIRAQRGSEMKPENFMFQPNLHHQGPIIPAHVGGSQAVPL